MINLKDQIAEWRKESSSWLCLPTDVDGQVPAAMLDEACDALESVMFDNVAHEMAASELRGRIAVLEEALRWYAGAYSLEEYIAKALKGDAE